MSYVPRDYVVSDKRTFLGTVFYEPIAGSLRGSPAEEDAGILMKRSGTALQARVRVIESGKIGETSKVTLMKNGQSTGLVVQVTGAYPANDHQLFESSATVVATFAADDKLYWKIEPKSEPAGRAFKVRSISLRIQ